MGKPLGLTGDLQVKRPTRAQDALWDAVEEEIDAGLTPEQFRAEAAEAWAYHLKAKADDARKALTT